jgi:S1-C subfamily serine protease
MMHVPTALPPILLFCALAAPPTARAAEPAPLDALQNRIIEVSQHVTPSVVHIEAIVKHDDRRQQVTGSGLIVRADGLILTNEHVVEKAEKVTVLVPGRRQKYNATVVGTDRQTDIGVLRIEPETPLPAAQIGGSDALQVGQWVLAIGNPYGLEGTVSFGIVSAKGRNLETDALLNDFIQTDAMIDRGSSGGPLVDLDGRVVGINSRGQGRGIGFTIPIDTALSVLSQIEGGRIERGWLGITVQPLDRELASYFAAPDATGVVVNSVTLDSPAARAGLTPGDVITALDGRAVEAEKEEDLGSFQRLVADRRPGQEVELRVLRDGGERSLRVELASQPKVVPEEAESQAGFHVQEITEQIFRSERLPARGGAFVSFVERGSPAAEAGIQRGDVVLKIDAAAVDDLDGFRRALAATEGRERFLVTARRGDELKFLLVKPRAAPPPASDTSDSTSAR